jgi:hypothetical protein
LSRARKSEFSDDTGRTGPASTLSVAYRGARPWEHAAAATTDHHKHRSRLALARLALGGDRPCNLFRGEARPAHKVAVVGSVSRRASTKPTPGVGVKTSSFSRRPTDISPPRVSAARHAHQEVAREVGVSAGPSLAPYSVDLTSNALRPPPALNDNGPAGGRNNFLTRQARRARQLRHSNAGEQDGRGLLDPTAGVATIRSAFSEAVLTPGSLQCRVASAGDGRSQATCVLCWSSQ